jgi:hypothetical protein
VEFLPRRPIFEKCFRLRDKGGDGAQKSRSDYADAYTVGRSHGRRTSTLISRMAFSYMAHFNHFKYVLATF